LTQLTHKFWNKPFRETTTNNRPQREQQVKGTTDRKNLTGREMGKALVTPLLVLVVFLVAVDALVAVTNNARNNNAKRSSMNFVSPLQNKAGKDA